MWCPHNTKVGSKMETMQETVSDVSDVLHCMKKLPTVHILDDACHFTRLKVRQSHHCIIMIIWLICSHSFIKYPEESRLSLGSERRGCFEAPSEHKEPTMGINCTEILPIGRNSV